MARLPRLAIAGHAHLVLQQGHSGVAVFRSDDDCLAYLEALRESASALCVAVHAYALLPDQVLLLMTPVEGSALGALMQALGRRFGAAMNRRYARSGSLWSGRFRATVVEPGAWDAAAQKFVEQAPLRVRLCGDASTYAWSSAGHHLGLRHEAWLTALPSYWQLGNTPFEREGAYARQLVELQAEAESQRLEAACRKAWAVGSTSFLHGLEQQGRRPVSPRPRGRPSSS